MNTQAFAEAVFVRNLPASRRARRAPAAGQRLALAIIAPSALFIVAALVYGAWGSLSSWRPQGTPRFMMAALQDSETPPPPEDMPPINWRMTLQPDATPRLWARHTPVVEATYRFWGANWQWMKDEVSLDKTDETKEFSGAVSGLGIAFKGTIKPGPNNVLTYAWTWEASRPLENIIGGGLEFRLELDSPALYGQAKEPELLPDNRGWQWSVEGKTVRVEFSKPLADVYFEKGNKNVIRTFFVGKNVTPGKHEFNMTVTLPEGGRYAPAPSERYARIDPPSWSNDAMLWNASPVDLSFLNEKPAGTHGKVKAKGDGFVFEDGTPVRFWGTNLAAGALFANKSQVNQQAKRIAELGYNLVRIHHHDSDWVKPNVFDESRDNTQFLNETALDRIDYWVSALKDQGVYVWLDLHVGRRLRRGDLKGVEGADEILKQKGDLRGFSHFNRSVQELMEKFNREYLTHVNRYTNLALKDDPAVMGVLITNENDITHHFGNLMLPDKNNPVHNAAFEKAIKEFCARTELPLGEVRRSWEPGPGKLFLSDHEYAWGRDMVDKLRKLGVTVPIATTSLWGNNPIYSLPALTAGSMIDVHSYGDSETLSVNPRYQANLVTKMAMGQVYGMPLTVSEWNVPYPSTDRFTVPLYVASVACLQGWDAMMLYNYSQQGFGKPSRPSQWSTFYDPAIQAVMPGAALIYRQQHVSPAKNTVCLKLNRQSTYFHALREDTCGTVRTLAEMSRVTIGLPNAPELSWDEEPLVEKNVKVLNTPNRDFIPPGANAVRSDTGELERNWVKGIQTINTPKTQAAAGWIGGEIIELADVAFNIKTSKATVAVTSMDDKPITESSRLLITTVARAVALNNTLPFLTEPVVGTISFKAREGLSVRPLNANGGKGSPLDALYSGGAYTVTLSAEDGHLWMLVE